MRLYDPAALDPRPSAPPPSRSFQFESDMFAAQVRLFQAEIALRGLHDPDFGEAPELDRPGSDDAPEPERP